MKAKLILGCHGRMHYGYLMCSGTVNTILDFTTLSKEQDFIFEYLDGHCKLFDQVTNDQNKILNVIQYLSRQKVIKGHIETTIYDYISIHKKCGLYMYIEPIEV